MFFKKAQPNQALVRVGAGGIVVSFDKLNVYPILHTLTTIDLSLHKLSLHLVKEQAVLCKDFVKADIKVVFCVKVNAYADDIKQVLRSFDTAKLTDPEYLAECFFPDFEYAIRVVGQVMTFTDISKKTLDFADTVMDVVGRDLCGFELDDMIVESVEQTSLDFYDDNDYLEQQGKVHIKQFITQQNVNDGQESSAHSYEALLTQQALEVELVTTEIQQKLEIARLKAEQEVLATQQSSHNNPELAKARQDEIAQALKKAEAATEIAQQKIKQLKQDAGQSKP